MHDFDDDEPVVIKLSGGGFEDVEPIVIHLAGDDELDRATVRDVGRRLPEHVGSLEITVAAARRAELQSIVGEFDVARITIIEIDPPA